MGRWRQSFQDSCKLPAATGKMTWNGFFQIIQNKPVLLIPGFWTSGLWNCENKFQF